MQHYYCIRVAVHLFWGVGSSRLQGVSWVDHHSSI